MSEVIIPDTVAELKLIWERGTAEDFGFVTDEQPANNGRFQMLQATKSGLIVVNEVPIVGVKFPQSSADPEVHKLHVFHITKKCRDDLYRVYGPGYWEKGVYFPSESGPMEFNRGDRVDFTLRLACNV